MHPVYGSEPLIDVDRIDAYRDILEQGALRHPDTLALEDCARTPIPRVTYFELHRSVIALGKAMRRIGIDEGTHVAVVSENRVQWGIAYLAIVANNCVAVPIDRNLKENEILTILHSSDATAAFFSESYRDMFTGFRHSVRALEHLVDMDLPAQRDGMWSMTELLAGERIDLSVDRLPAPAPAALAVLVFTSGSMGSAKGVMLSQRNITSNLMAMRSLIRIDAADRFLSVLPIHHTYECTCGFLCPLSAGGSVHYARSLKTVAEDMVTVRPTILLGVPLLYDKMYRRICNAVREKPVVARVIGPLQRITGVIESLGVHGIRAKVFHEIHERFGGAIRILIVGGAAPDPAVARGFRSFGFAFIQGYGLTETSPILALNRLTKFRDDAAGLPLPGVELRIDNADADGRGEILARGPSVMLGYYRNDEATAAVMTDGWFHTGDYGSIDEQGFLRICGRKKNVIIARNGKNVFPEEMEEHVNRIPFVLESVIHGRRNEKGDEEIAVIIVPNAEQFFDHAHRHGHEVTEEYIRETLEHEIRALNRHLPVYKQIRHITVQQTEFEKTSSQKIKRYMVKQDESVR